MVSAYVFLVLHYCHAIVCKIILRWSTNNELIHLTVKHRKDLWSKTDKRNTGDNLVLVSEMVLFCSVNQWEFKQPLTLVSNLFCKSHFCISPVCHDRWFFCHFSLKYLCSAEDHTRFMFRWFIKPDKCGCYVIYSSSHCLMPVCL